MVDASDVPGTLAPERAVFGATGEIANGRCLFLRRLHSSQPSISRLPSLARGLSFAAMTKRRMMHLVAFLLAGPTAHHHGAWRHPEADLGVFTPEWHEHIARVLEQGRFDSLFFADILGLYDLYGGSFATILRCGGQMGLLDPIPLLSIMSRATSRIGLGATLSSTFYPPYFLARALGTLDLLSGGRVAWNVVASHGHLEAQNFGVAELPARDARYDYADEVVEAVCRLWESWDADALVLDKQRGVFADPAKVHYANYQGRWISTRGPLTVPRSPQGRPVIMRRIAADRGRCIAGSLRVARVRRLHPDTDADARHVRAVRPRGGAGASVAWAVPP
jgi:alkanesulfonate monooxygenase SsuD/methylene tetrahydromethanopterin reductase-like flavin-dependent oxidoreductase (luciferase family)